jgi:RNA polymerase sigma-70 factor (ECF subfamily)
VVDSILTPVSLAPVRGPAFSASANAAIGPLVAAEIAHVWRALRRFGLPASDADDAAQQVFLIAARRLDDIEAGKQRAFLYGVAANVALKARRGAARRREDPLDVDAPDPRPNAEELVDHRRARECLDRILDGLDHDLRVVFVLHEVEGLATSEIAGALGIPPGTAASRLRRAREAFAARLARLRLQLGGRR